MTHRIYADQRKIRLLLKKNHQVWNQTRVIAIKMAFSLANPVSIIAVSCAVRSMTVNRCIVTYLSGGLTAVLSRGLDNNNRPLKADLEVLEYLSEGRQAKHWNTLVEPTAALERRVEDRFAYKKVWTWVKNARRCFGFPTTCMRRGSLLRRVRSSATSFVSSKTCLCGAKNW